MRKADKFYCLCQVCGWGAYSAVGLWSAVLDHGWTLSVTGGYLLFFLYSIALTHLLRRVVHRRNWSSLPLPRILVRMAVASVLIGAIQAALVVGVYTALEGSMGIWRDKSSVAFLFMGVSVITTIWSVLYLTITTMRHSREMRQNQIQMKLALSDAELRALEAQVNPHFLFNCLNSIRGMIVEDPEHAQDMVTKLANILRYSLQRDRKHTVRLETEVEVVADYLALEAVRFDERLHVQFDVAEKAGQIEIPPMLLQTLVENAVKHGTEKTAEEGQLSVRAALEGNQLRIEVENAGRLDPPLMTSTQVGLANARERLRILYGESATLNLLASGQGRVTATVLIPALQ